ncbi:putative AAA+ superfamily ATPase [Dyadobacter sp. BE34]|uniref:AAA+ superfamily ATPase n=1 Tax=Dyadobacter fermentans TaxID=94254 RepID=A0ABU1R6G0_9BACT|nr:MULTISPECIES: ATP-binding protein [Dyadobacter]MDR6808999.1 putative AAA+ superfamily ATPase [Dyadobacter fermentans]MDR7046742.1 putative AAA+ superfamily ATPase [Dyadobacter sp. BE242]MDR7201056.1 putative AAA+ superfamily ATPase [Dyadobacter sp. BE34]MDR7219016.1 putative AAA+ superfamily ATPase [Dyadobacter sp. BE31]MDR7264774.1 putative AAA+ superfamily ATPase [Dyadobacter sp. BE32]
MFVTRYIYPKLLAHSTKRQITVLTGMRRTGKTTLLKQLMAQCDISQKHYFDLERIDVRALFSEPNYETIVQALSRQGTDFSKKVLICIDEIQLVLNLPSVLKYLYDTYDVKFIVTGSSAYYMKSQFSESLAGRKKIFEIYPLTFGELLAFKGVQVGKVDVQKASKFVTSEYERLKGYYNEFIDFGGFPEVVLADSAEDKRDLISDIISSYINFDLTLLSDIRSPTNLYKLIKLLSVRIGTKLDISKLTSLTGMARQTVENYLDLLEKSYLIRTIPVIANSPDREIVKAKKIYFLDNGIASLAGELSSGSKFENAVFNQLMHLGEVAYYQLKTGREIDFILDQKQCFEVKETATEADLKNTASLARNLDISESYVIGRHPVRVFEGFIWGGFLQ